MNRLLTKREKSSHRRSKSSEPKLDKPRPLSSSGIFGLFKPAEKLTDKKVEKIDAKKVAAIKQRLHEINAVDVEDPQIEYALQTKYAEGDVDKAYEILVLFQQSVEGIIIPFNSRIHMRGAENREGVTCYLDSLLFAMFSRLQSFERILTTRFDDEPRRRLSTLIRLWVNMLRTGKLIQTDITQHLQEALKACGWDAAARLQQQDTSEAFGFIAMILELPLLTLEVDLFHEGKADDKDDHKFVHERLLEVAVPQESTDGKIIRLEDCLEEHFNTKVDVVREREREKTRRNTLQRISSQSSTRSGLPSVNEKMRTHDYYRTPMTDDKDEDENEGSAEHVENATPAVKEPALTKQPEVHSSLTTVDQFSSSSTEILTPTTEVMVTEIRELDEDVKATGNRDNSVAKPISIPGGRRSTFEAVPQTPQTPIIQSPINFPSPPNSTTPTKNTPRSSGFVRRYTISQDEPGEAANSDAASVRSSLRKLSIRKEVLMPAWQFYRIIRVFNPISSPLPQILSNLHELELIDETAWYTNKVPETDSQVAAQFNQDRPVLGICLKRYRVENNGAAVRQNTAIDIPLQIALPTFVQDDKASESGALFGNFVLKLVSVVCHRGRSVHSGHYISLAREEYQSTEDLSQSTESFAPPEYSADRWLKHDDLAKERVQYVDIEKTMKEEMPYLLFYQVQPICPEPPPESIDHQPLPPSYKDLGIDVFIQESTPIITKPGPNSFANFLVESGGYFDPSGSTVAGSSTTLAGQATPSRNSFSDDIDRPGTNTPDGRTSLNLPDFERRGSLTFTDAITTSNSTASQPVTPGEDTSSRLSRAASVFGRRSANKSRPTSHVDENRISEGRLSTTLSRMSLNLMAKASKEPLVDKQRSGDNSSVTAYETTLGEIAQKLRTTQEKDNAENGDKGKDSTLPSQVPSGLPLTGGVVRSSSKKGKKGKSKGSDYATTSWEIVGGDKHHHQIHQHTHNQGGKEKGKGKDKDGHAEKDDEKDRQCSVM